MIQNQITISKRKERQNATYSFSDEKFITKRDFVHIYVDEFTAQELNTVLEEVLPKSNRVYVWETVIEDFNLFKFKLRGKNYRTGKDVSKLVSMVWNFKI